MSEKYLHLSLYQLGVSTSIEQRLKDITKNEDEFTKAWNEYEHRLGNLIKVNKDWKDIYTQLMNNAYKGTIQKYNKQEE